MVSSPLYSFVETTSCFGGRVGSFSEKAFDGMVTPQPIQSCIFLGLFVITNNVDGGSTASVRITFVVESGFGRNVNCFHNKNI